MIVTISIIEAIYVLYMLRYFKTTVSFSYAKSTRLLYKIAYNLDIDKNYVAHPDKSSIESESHICNFGQDVSILISLFFLLRAIMLYYNKKWYWKFNTVVILSIFILSFLNMNAFVYLLPVFITEIYVMYKH